MATDWLKLLNEYLDTPISLRGLAEKYGVSRTTLQRYAAREHWAAIKQARLTLCKTTIAVQGKTSPEMIAQVNDGNPTAAIGSEPTVSPKVERVYNSPAAGKGDRLAQLLAIGDQLMVQLARATVELDKQTLKRKRKTREVVYDGVESRGKPVEETVEENYELQIVDSTVDCGGLQKLSATLKNLREVAMSHHADEDSTSRVQALMNRLDDDAAGEES